MDNASKAITFAGGVFLAVLIISIAMFSFNMIKEFNGGMSDRQTISEIGEFNKYFINADYDLDSIRPGTQIYSWDAFNILRKVEDIYNDGENSNIIYVNDEANQYTDKGYLKYLTLFMKNNASGDPIIDESKFLMDDNETLVFYDYEYSMGKFGYIDRITITPVG